VARIGNALVYFLAGYGASTATWGTLLATAVIGNVAVWIARKRAQASAALVAGVTLIAASVVSMLSLLKVAPFEVANPGLLAASPLLILALLGIPATPGIRGLQRGLWMVCAGYTLGMLVFPTLAYRAAGVMTQMTSTWGSRYFLAIYPLGAIVALSILSRILGASPNRLTTVLLSLASTLAVTAAILGTLSGLFRIANDKQHIGPTCAPIWDTSAKIVVTDDWWRSLECAGEADQTHLLVTDANTLPTIVQQLWRANTTEFIFASRDGLIQQHQLVEQLHMCYDLLQVAEVSAVHSGTIVKVTMSERFNHCPQTNNTG
jgi:hypothetical protein